MSPLLALLIGGASVLSGFAIGVSAILGEQKRRKRFAERLTQVAGAHMRANPFAEMGRATATTSVRMVSLIAAAAQVFGYNSTHAEHYPLRWWIVLSITLALARASAAMPGVFFGPWSLLVVPVLWVMLSRFAFHWSEQRRRNALYAQFPDALAMIVRAVRVGIPLSEGIHTVASEAMPPTAPEFRQLYDRVSIGVTLEDALREMAERNKLPEYRFFATALALQSRTGGGLSEALEGLAEVMRRRLAMKARGHALAAEAKTSIMILASLPFVAGGALAVLNPRYIGRLFTDPGGQKVLIAAIGLLGGGLLIMRGMIRKALS